MRCRHPGFDPGLRRSPGEGSGNPLQDSCLRNPLDGETWWATVRGVAESDRTEQPTVCLLSCIFSRPEHRSGQPFPSAGDLPNPGVKRRSPSLESDSLPAGPPGRPKGPCSLGNPVVPTSQCEDYCLEGQTAQLLSV